MHRLARLDHRYVWHPFTQMKDWLKREPIMLVSGKGAVLRDVRGREYLDANSSIWTNLHGHRHPKIDRGIASQLKKIAHSSALGFANEPASILAERLVKLANPRLGHRPSAIGHSSLTKVFFSDDGSTAMEVALKLSYEFTRRTRKAPPRFLTLDGAYHGDTIGAVSLGQIDLFHTRYRGLLFKSDRVMAPYCYRCPFNRAKPERADARSCRKCNWECVGLVERKVETAAKRKRPYSAMAIEPLIQGAAGMIPQPEGWLRKVAEIVRGHGAQIIADEVMTGLGRTGISGEGAKTRSLFACHQEQVQPDFLVAAKGLTGGYLPMAATLTTQDVFDAFLGDYAEFKTFFHGHSFTANQLGAAAACANLEILGSPRSLRQRRNLENQLRGELASLWSLPNVGDVRQVGLIAGIELVRNWQTREPFAPAKQVGIRVCEAMAKRGVLTRPIGSIIVLMPPYCTAAAQLTKMVTALKEAIEETFRSL